MLSHILRSKSGNFGPVRNLHSSSSVGTLVVLFADECHIPEPTGSLRPGLEPQSSFHPSLELPSSLYPSFEPPTTLLTSLEPLSSLSPLVSGSAPNHLELAWRRLASSIQL